MEHQETDGTIKPPSISEQTDLPVSGLTQPAPMRRLTLTEADMLRAEKAFGTYKEPLPVHIVMGLNNLCLQLSEFIIKNSPEGKERSQALGQVHAAKLWAVEAMQNG